VVGEFLGKHQDEEIHAQCEIINWPKYTEVIRNYFSEFFHLFSLFPFFQVRHFFFFLIAMRRTLGLVMGFPKRTPVARQGRWRGSLIYFRLER
jgi:hypothetical protein